MIRLLKGAGTSSALMCMAVALAAPAQAQSEYDVRGVVADSAGNVSGAMVVALTRADSVLTKFATTDGDGAFMLRRLPPGEYILQVTFIGYAPFRKDFAVVNADVDAGTVNLTQQAYELDPLEVSVDHIPFVNKGDTLSYNVLAFPTRPNATVEDLLRRLPGIQVEADGSIKALGEDVTKVLVEGKEFFGSDPTVATRSLSADAVKRVDVFDKLSDLAEFTGVADGEEERTLDLKLNDDAKQGWFGRLSSGLGADGGRYGAFASPGEEGVRYDETFGVNRFTATTQLAVVGNVNNVNETGFAWSDYQAFIGGAKGLAAGGRGDIQGGGRNDGFTEAHNLGFNVGHDFAARSWVRSSYFLSGLDNLQNRTVQRQQLLGSNGSSFGDGANSERTENTTHRFDLNAQYTLGEAHDLRLRANLSSGSSSLASFGFQSIRTAVGDTLSSAATSWAVDADDLAGSANLIWRKRIDDSGRTVVAEVRANLSDPDMTGDLSSTTGSYRSGAITYADILQQQSRHGRTFGQSQRISLTQPVGGNSLLELYGNRRAIDQDETRSIYDLDDDAPVLNDLLSSEYERTYTYLGSGLRLTRNADDKLLVLGFQVQNSDLDGTIVDRNESISNGYTHVLPSARFKAQIGRPGRSFDLRYTTSTREPTLVELQPSADNSNPVNVYVGNPNLRPEYTHQLVSEYRFFDQFDFTNLYMYVRYGYTSSDIAQSRTVDEQGFQVFSPINTDHSWSANGGASYGMPIRSIGARADLAYDFLHTRGSEYVNAVENASRSTRHTVKASLENRVKDLFDIRAGGSVTFNEVDYSLNGELNQSYTNSTIFASGAWYYRDAWTFASSLNYQVFDQDVFGSSENIAFLDASISRLFMNDRGELHLSVFDLLDQNQGVSFTNTPNLIQETRVESLGRRLMLKFTWRLGRVGGGTPLPKGGTPLSK